MVKVKKNVPSSKGEKSNVDGVKSASKVEKSNVKHVLKPRDINTSIGEMVAAALEALRNDRGVSLIQIRKFIMKNNGGFGTKMSKERQAGMRQYLKEEFQKGKVVMTNYDGEKINFIMRFNRFNLPAK